jgi:GH35 family endo-1,4-beta-xylanase
MKTLYNNSIGLCAFVAISLLINACKDKEMFADGDKRQYINAANYVQPYSGYKRLQLKFGVANTEAVSAKIYWNNRSNVMEVPVRVTSANDTVSAIVGPLEEGAYNFEVITYDSKGNTSVPVKITATALGPNYAHGLANRPIKDIFYENGNATIYWGNTGAELFNEVIYTDNANVQRRLKVNLGKDTTKLMNVKPGALATTMQYRTAYKPAMAIDTFYADSKAETIITGSLKDLAKAKNVLFGSLISYGSSATHGVVNDGSPNGIYKQICDNEFNFGQASWGGTRWKREGNSDFNDVNAVINWSKAHYNKVFAQLIVGPNGYMPDWFKNGTFTPAEMDGLLKGLVKEFMETNDNKSKVDVWGVANEVFSNDGTYVNMKWNEMGWEDDASGLTGTDKINLKHPVFIGKAFQYSRQMTQALLELRDHDFEYNTSASAYYTKHKAYYQLLRHLKAKGYPVDVVGIQAHYNVGSGIGGGYELFKNTIEKFKATGVQVHLTELDIIVPKINNALQPWSLALADQQKTDYYNAVKAAVEAGVSLISLWGVRDNNDPGWRFGQYPLLYDENYNRKPAYYGVQKALFDAKK